MDDDLDGLASVYGYGDSSVTPSAAGTGDGYDPSDLYGTVADTSETTLLTDPSLQDPNAETELENAYDGTVSSNPTSSPSLLSSIGSGLSAIGQALGLTSPAIGNQLAQQPSSPFQALGLTTANGALTTTGIALLVGGVALILLSRGVK